MQRKRAASTKTGGATTAARDWAEALAFDRIHLWHPYSSMTDPPPAFPVVSAARAPHAR